MKLNEYCRAVGRDCRMTAADRVVMWTMQSYTDWRSGETFVSLATIATDICVDVRSVRRIVRRLEGYGVITAGERRVGRSTVYRFPLHPAVTAATPDPAVRGQISTTPDSAVRGQDIHTPDPRARDPGPTGPGPRTHRSSISLY